MEHLPIMKNTYISTEGTPNSVEAFRQLFPVIGPTCTFPLIRSQPALRALPRYLPYQRYNTFKSRWRTL